MYKDLFSIYLQPSVNKNSENLAFLILHADDVTVKTINCVAEGLAELRSRYWGPRGRQVVKRISSECVTCRRFTAKPYSTPPTAALPDLRVKEGPQFSRVGVDFAGPLNVKEKSGQIVTA